MLIGELADQAGVPPKTIRYYEEIRLLPEPDRTSGGYRDFDQEALSRLRLARKAREVPPRTGKFCHIIESAGR